MGIIEETHIGLPWSVSPPSEIPFSNITSDQAGARPTSPPTTLTDLDPFGLSEFESGQATVRNINQGRVNHQVGDRLARIDFGTPDINRDLFSPEVLTSEITVRAPPP